MDKKGLVLEGGGMRGLYTAGVLDLFLEKDIDMKYCIGVSAGATQTVSYLSKQHKRNYRINLDYIKDKRYLSFRNLFKTGSIFGMNMIFNIIPNELDPFDYKEFKENDVTFVVGVTNCETGKPEYYNVDDLDHGVETLKATMSLPLVAPIVEYEGKKLLDGGITDPIPIRKSIEDGNEKHVVVLTQHKGYKKEKNKALSFVRRKYKRFPKLIEALEKRHEVYNETLELLDKLEQEGKCFIIRPSEPLNIGRLERNTDKLNNVYEQGYDDAKILYNKLVEFLEK